MIKFNHTIILGLQMLLYMVYSVTSSAQAVLNIKAVQNGTDVVITYDLPDHPNTEDYTVEIFASHNNFQRPLQKVVGDVGIGIRAGTGKKVIWNAKNELGNFAGELLFEINAIPRIVFKPLMLVSPTATHTLRQGKKINIQWEGGNPSANVSLQWRQGETVVKVLSNLPNTKSYRLPIDKTMKKGIYQLVLLQGAEQVSSEPLTIKTSIPLALKLAPLAVAGLVVVILDPFGSKETSSGLPRPPDPN